MKPSWSAKIQQLRGQLQLNQTQFGQKLRSSAMAVSRWERGAQEPPSHVLARLYRDWESRGRSALLVFLGTRWSAKRRCHEGHAGEETPAPALA